MAGIAQNQAFVSFGAAPLGRAFTCRVHQFALPGGFVLGIALMVGCGNACAAGIGSLSTSIGLFAALAALSVIKAWPSHLAMAWPAVGGALLVAGGAAWLWRARAALRLLTNVDLARGHLATQTDSASLKPAQLVALPQGFDRASLLVELRLHFVTLQAAWDLADMPAMGTLTTPEMLRQLCIDLQDCRTEHVRQRTEVVTVHAELLACDELPEDFLLTVAFSGLLREAPTEAANPFKEVWLLTKPRHVAAGWRLARHQVLF
jgi:predicted lipid-binding transport protein (Tim44 family)